MSVFLLKSENEAEVDSPSALGSGQNQPVTEASQALMNFWPKCTEEIRRIENMDSRCQRLPLSRIKKIMRLDEDVKMISAEAPVLFAKAAELFILELTLRAWLHTEDNKRRTLQRNDIAMAITKYDQFDFLIDIVPRDEVKVHSSRMDKAAINADQVHYYFQLAQQHQAAMQSGSVPVQVVQPTQIQTIALSQDQIKNGGGAAASTNATQAGAGNVQLVQQVVTASGEVQHIPIQLNNNQLQMIRMQVQGSGSGTSQPIILQAAPTSQPQPHILQVSQSSGSTPVFVQPSNGTNNE